MSNNDLNNPFTTNNNNINETKKKKRTSELALELVSKLIDNQLVNRYGTSIRQNFAIDQEEKIIQKYEVLKNEFEKINKDDNDFIDLEEFKTFVKSYENTTHKKLPKGYCEQLFSLIDIDHDKKITIQEFVSSYILLEEKLKLKKIKLTKLLDEINDSLQQSEVKLKKYDKEVLNFNGLIKDASIMITIMEARDLRPMDFNGKSDPYCIISLNGKHKQTTSYKPNTLNPVWNENFNIPVVNKNEVLLIEVMDKDTFGSDDIEGLAEISVKELMHQQRIDDWVGLKSKEGEKEMGYLRVRVQLLWSRKQFYSDLLIKTNNQALRVKKDLNELEKYIVLIDKPFGILLYGEIINITNSKILEKGEEVIHYSENQRNYLATSKIRDNESLAVRLGNMFQGVISKCNI